MRWRSSATRTDDGKWNLRYRTGSVYPAYADMLQVCLNTLDGVYGRAKERDEFEFLCSLLRVSESKAAGWDSWETLESICDLHNRLKSRRFLSENDVTHLSLFVYGQIVEASEPYELLANLLNVIDGHRFKHTNFPYRKDWKGRWRAQHFLDKIAQLRSSAAKARIDLSFFDRFVDNDLRNAVFHSDYSIYWPEVRVSMKRFSHAQWMTLINGALAYVDALRMVHQTHVGMYNEPTLICVFRSS